MLKRLMSNIDNQSHPLHSTISRQKSIVSDRLSISYSMNRLMEIATPLSHLALHHLTGRAINNVQLWTNTLHHTPWTQKHLSVRKEHM